MFYDLRKIYDATSYCQFGESQFCHLCPYKDYKNDDLECRLYIMKDIRSVINIIENTNLRILDDYYNIQLRCVRLEKTNNDLIKQLEDLKNG